jgi:hypothetical protein
MVRLKLKRLKLRYMVWRKKRAGFFDWKESWDFPLKKREADLLRKTGLVNKVFVKGTHYYRYNYYVYKRTFGIC